MPRTLALTALLASGQLLSAGHPSRADWNNLRNERHGHTKWHERMDIGPAWANTFGDYYQGKKRTGSLKGLRLELSKDDDIFGLFDTETLRFSTVYRGSLHWGGTPWTGAHGALIHLANEAGTIYQNTAMPGWADKGRSFAETRKIPGHGNLAADHARWSGHFRHGEQVILDYSVLGSRVLELPGGRVSGGHPMAFRQIDMAPCDHDRVLLVASHGGATIKIGNGQHSATAVSNAAALYGSDAGPSAGETRVVMDRTDGDWGKLSMGAPSAKDLADRSTGKHRFFRVLPDFTQTHDNGGDEEGVAVRLNDGLAAHDGDDAGRSFFFADADKPGRLELNLRGRQAVSRIHLFSQHKGARAPQDVEIYGTADEHADASLAPWDLTQGGWEKLAAYDTRKLGDGGRHGVAVLAPGDGDIGSFRKLLFICKPGHEKDAMQTYFSEIDVYGRQAPALKPLAQVAEGRNPGLAVAVRGNGVSLRDAGNGTLTLLVPASKQPTRFSLGYAAAYAKLLDSAMEAVQAATPAPRELGSLTKGGPAIYPQAVTATASLGSGDGTWLVDQVGLPVDNPWLSNIRPGGFDFFPDGDSAAISTWNGDVWVVRGLKGDWKQVRWRRFATGLFEPLGLKIVDGLIYVHGRDQITRLHDQNSDGEADWYECFNNDVLITRNFHEFAFSLQTDKEGNFYFTKASPVLGGGRGFDTILPHNGTVMRVSREGKNLEVLATGLRAPGGLAVGPNGEITTGENEGTWQPCCKLNYFTGKDKFLGVEDSAHHLKGREMHPPLCYFPMRIDNSGGEQAWVPEPEDGAPGWGLKPHELVHLSYGKSSLYRVLREEVDGTAQGGVVRIPVNLKSSAMRARFHPDGSLYVLGFRGWQTNASTPQAFHRIRFNNRPVTIPDQLRATDKGLYIRFEKELDGPSVADRFNFKVERWKYIRSSQYGSGEFSIDNPDPEAEQRALTSESHKYRKHDQVEVVRSVLLPDKKTVFLHIPSMKPAQQMSIVYKLVFADSTAAEGEIVNTLHKMARHREAILLGKVTEASAGPRDLQPGLVQRMSAGGMSDQRVNRLPALYVGAGESVSDMLSAGEFTSEWFGFLKTDERISPRFSLQGRGTASLSINGKEILSVTGDGETFGKALSAPVRLNPGAHRFMLKYRSATSAGQVRVLWETDTMPRQSIPPAHFAHQPGIDLQLALSARAGRDLLLEQKCTNCHLSPNKTHLPDHLEMGPNLEGIASRRKPGWIAQWLAQPHAMNPAATMPAFVDAGTGQGRQDAADMAAYLALFTAKGEAARENGAESAAGPVKAGGGVFHTLGCIACHQLPGATPRAGDTRTPLHNVGGKFTAGSLAGYLARPDRHYPAGKMPDFQLGKDEASQLAAFLIDSSKGKGTAPVPLPKGDAARGKQLVLSHNCAACHQGLEPGTAKLPGFGNIMGWDWRERGCISSAPSEKSPRFNLTAAQRKTLAQYRESYNSHGALSLSHTSAHDYAERQLKALNCMACHDRDGQQSLLASLHSQSQPLAQGLPVNARHKIDQTRPHLTFIGGMLHTDYMQRMLDGSVKKRPRPWLAMRMPAFHSRARQLADGLSKQHGMAPSAPEPGGTDAAKAGAGKKLIGSSGGFACTICHADGDTKATAAFEVEGVNFDQVARRLRPGYYHRWMENPQSITPSTKMPRYTQGNKSPLPDYGNDARKQFDAILEYFRSLEKEDKE